ncbi:MAG: hypothetical protein RLZZ305_1691 [Actinomycetota bacterium]
MHLDAPPQKVVPFLADLSRYPEWMPLVHRADRDVSAPPVSPAWNVELRARVGPFARSKRLRMVRTEGNDSPGASGFVFERREANGSAHSPWTMRVVVAPAGGGSDVTIDLHYGGSLWTAGVLDRVLAAQIDAGKEGLARAVSG